MTMKILMTALFLALAAVPMAGNALTDSLHCTVRVGYNVGGNAPLGMPATIRKINSYTPQMNPSVGFDALVTFTPRWGAMAGLRFENKGMREDAQVKNYHMEITKGGETLAGMFTGDVTTKTAEWMITLPIQAALKVSKVNLRLGPYVSYLITREFSGWAHNGYLRVDDPTGAKVELGEAANERGNYDFSGKMRHWHWGLGLGADWRFNHRMGAYAELNWGLSPTMKSDFHTIEQTLYPIYATLGLTYRLR